MIKLISFLTVLFLFFSCTSNLPVKTLIDNPTSATIHIELDSEKISIAPESTHSQNLNIGKHTLKYQGKKIDFKLKLSHLDGLLINPTKSDYIISEEFYYFDESAVDYNLLHEKRKKINLEYENNKYHEKLYLLDTIIIDDKKYVGFIQKKNSILMDKTWDIDLNEDLPEEIYAVESSGINGLIDGTDTKTKIHRDYLFKFGYENGVFQTDINN